MIIYARLLSLLAILFCSLVQANEDKTILIAILAKDKAHCLPKYLNCIDNLDYDKNLITIYINTNNNSDHTEELLTNWAALNKDKYHYIDFESHEVENAVPTRPHEWTPERFKILGEIRNKSMQRALEYNCDYYFVIDCDNFITPCTLKALISKNKPIIAPMLTAKGVKGDIYSNYFCDITSRGYYKHHEDYIKILNLSNVGIFKVPVVHCTYLIQSEYIDKLTYIDGSQDYEFVIFSRNARQKQIDQYICNEQYFGWLLHFNDDLTLEEEAEKFEKLFESETEDFTKNA